MYIEEAVGFYSALSVEEQKEFLAQLSHKLTILGRDAYEVGTENFTNPSQMRAVNEIQHRIASHLLALIKNDANRRSDEDLVRVIIEHSHDKNFERKAIRAFERIANKFAVAV